jgi:outer membrane protein assembly factor BamB
MLPTRQTLAVVLAASVLTALALAPAAVAQPQQKPPPPKEAEVKDALTLPMADKTTKDSVLAAPDYIAAKKWTEAIDLLQRLVDRKEDVFVEVKHKDAAGKESTTLVSVRAEGNRLISTLPPEGLEFYRVTYNPKAKALLKQAQSTGDPMLLEQVSRRYLYTESGVEATQLLAGASFDRGEELVAALVFERLLERQPLKQWPADALFKASATFRIARDKDRADKTWQELKQRADGKALTIGGRTMSLAEWEKELEKVAVLPPTPPGKGGKPFLEKLWSKSPFTGLSDFTRDDNPPSRPQIQDAVKSQEGRGHPILPAFFPILADGKLIYRSYWGTHAVDVKTGKLVWEVEWKGSLEKLLKSTGPVLPTVNNWIAQYKNTGKANVLYENSATGTLSADNKFVYAVEDLALPPITTLNALGAPFPGPPQVNLGPLTDTLYHNKLAAYDLKTGKLHWEVGGHDKEKAGELADTFFLGPPLPIHGKLYVLTEKNQELRLVCLDPSPEGRTVKPEVVWSQRLADVRDKLLEDPGRRMQAVLLAAGGGILVCPTNAGAVLGVDSLTGSLLWVHSYREKGQLSSQEEDMIRMGMIPPPPGWQPRAANTAEWKVSAPVISDDKVVFTAPDARAVTCLNLRDGSVFWKVTRTDDDLYLGGVVAGKVLIVSKKSCRALNLADGKQAWQVETGTPSGRGVAADGLYYLPLKVATTIRDKEPIPAVLVIDAAKGLVHATIRSRKKEVPGNLLFSEDTVISQGVGEVAAFPQLDAKRAEITRLLADNPRDPIGLSGRADVNLDAGNWQGAVDDLRAVLAVLKDKPDAATEAKARDKLFEALTGYLQRDFDKAEKYLDDYKALCKITPDANAGAEERARAEEQTRHRLVNYFSLLARGREAQGKAVEAVRAYLEMADLGKPDELVASPLDPALKVSLPVLVAGRIKALLGKATPEQRKLIEEEIEKRWKDLRKEDNLTSLRGFVRLAGDSAAGQEARLVLAERLVKSKEFTEAELLLLQVSRAKDEPQRAGRAALALALLNLERGLVADALYYYRILDRDYAKTVIRDGKTGSDLFGDIAADKRFLPFLEEPKDVWKGRLQGKTENGQWPQNQQRYTFEPAGEVLPFFQKHRVALDFQYHALKLSAGGEEVWSQNLTRTMFQNMMWTGASPNNPPRYPYHTVGHVIVLPLAHLVFGLDPVKKEVLWEKSLTGAAQTPQQWNNVAVDPKDGTLSLLYPDGYTQKLGQTGPVNASSVCLQTRDGLLAIDPADGRTLWSRSDVSSRAGLFGDGENVYVVDVNGDGAPARTRAFRAQDGVSVDVPDFTTVYQQRQRIFGRKILASETEKGKLVVRVYDPRTGKDDWRKEFAANSTLLRSEEPNLAGVVEPDGKLTVVDLTTQKQVLGSTLDPKHIEKVQGITLLGDRERFYVAINGPVDQNIMNWGGGIMPNLMPNSGYRLVPVNGAVYAFDRRTEKLTWRALAENQMLVLSHFAEVPVLLFTSRYTANVGGRFLQEVGVRAIAKHNGKLVYDEKLNQNTQQFHTLKVDPEAGVIELTAWNLRVRLGPKTDQPKKDEPK